MSAWQRLLVYLAGLAVLFGAGLGLGAAVGPFDTSDRPHQGSVHDMDTER